MVTRIMTALESGAPRPHTTEHCTAGAVVEADADLPSAAVEQALAAKEPL